MVTLKNILTEIQIILIAAILCFTLIPSMVFLLLIFVPIRFGVSIVAAFNHDLEGLIRNEHVWFANKLSPQSESNILIWSILNGNVSVEYARQRFQDKVMNFKKDGRFVYRGLQCTWTSFLGYAFWKLDRKFYLDNHIRRYDYNGALTIPSVCTRNELNKILGGLLNAPWDRERSPWEMVAIQNFQMTHSEQSSPQTVWIIRLDHVLADGYSVMELFRKICDSPFEFPKISTGVNRNIPLWKKLGAHFRAPYDVAAAMHLCMAGGTLGGSHEIFGNEERMVSVSSRVSSEAIKKIKNHFKVSYAAVITCIICGAIEKALWASKNNVPENIPAAFVLPKPNHPNGLCIHVLMASVECPLKNKNAVERLLQIQKNLKGLMNSTAPVCTSLILDLTANFPIAFRKLFVQFFLSLLRVPVAFSIFPTSMGAEFVDGHQILDVTGLLQSTLFQSTALSGGVNNEQRIGFSMEKDVLSFEAVQHLESFVEEELRNLLKLAAL